MIDKNTNEKSLTIIKENIFSKIKNFFVNLFKRKEEYQYNQNIIEEQEENLSSIPESNFRKEVKVEEKIVNIKLLKMKDDLVFGKIKEEDLPEQERKELREYLLEEIEKKKISINEYRNKIMNIRKQLAS